MPRFYIEAELAVDTQVELTETVFHHWVKVLRAQVGETATLFNGQGGEYEAELIEVNKQYERVKQEGDEIKKNFEKINIESYDTRNQYDYEVNNENKKLEVFYCILRIKNLVISFKNEFSFLIFLESNYRSHLPV